MKAKYLWTFLLALLCHAPVHADELTVSAAASLKEALRTIGEKYRQTRPQTELTFNFGSSGTLQKQIENGAPVDIFCAASSKNLARLREQKLVEAPLILARGELVLVAPKNSKFKNSKLTGIRELSSPSIRRVAIGGPGVPAGDYARETLNYYRINATQKLVLCKDVRAVLAQVAAGNVDAGFAYRTDALSSPQVRIVALIEARAHSPIVYPVAVVRSSKNKASAREFVAFCRSKTARDILRSLGFRAG